jgi:hypothetical protein
MTIKLISRYNDFGDVECFASGGDYVHFFAGDKRVCLDGDFTISDLEIILIEMKRHLTPLALDGATAPKASGDTPADVLDGDGDLPESPRQ